MKRLGSKHNPVKNNTELYNAAILRKNCFIWVKGTFKIDNLAMDELISRKIFLVNIENKEG